LPFSLPSCCSTADLCFMTKKCLPFWARDGDGECSRSLAGRKKNAKVTHVQADGKMREGTLESKRLVIHRHLYKFK